MVGMSKTKPEPKALPKRFYAAASVQQTDDGFLTVLDGKPIKTPQQKLLQCASQRLALAIAAEWEAQHTYINTDTMPLTRLLTIALDRVAMDRAALLADIGQYCETDLLFYRAPSEAVIPVCASIPGSFGNMQWSALMEIPARASLGRDDGLATAASLLRELQHKHFTPILDWCSKTYGMTFTLTEGVMPVSQPADTLAQLKAIFAAALDHELAALAMMVPILGSALLTLAVWKSEIGIEDALTAARLDETVQAKYWGEDAEVTAKWADKCRDARACAFFLTCKH